ncbi:MAG: ankyrin repeat domain-containing protein [Candidatus Omnitrophica bacterium]|nr:ankyrin repeat domain-containing protein [Candidatus Omnitrophota bacterium]
MALTEGDLETAKEILNQRPDLLEGSPESMETPLHRAARFGHMDLVRMLVSKGADLNAKTPEGSTPWKAAAYNGHHEIADWLKGVGAEWESIDPH